ncbi:hypothetical protein [Nocardioides sp. Soil805]|uniref:hypothetical protein n=1 Tax=Nocardioides sp. Soil805 TaxID=1736416 RepID=UPI00070242DC|nr:hypothetical protein [Nocardioides sp. Soil805]KRF37617.1 hypothetical protein ASG94_10050 [Nocardioides sp. Soil805]
MASYESPGVYIEEVSSGTRPLEAVGTAIAAFVGFAERRPVETALGLAAVVGVALVVVRARRH